MFDTAEGYGSGGAEFELWVFRSSSHVTLALIPGGFVVNLQRSHHQRIEIPS